MKLSGGMAASMFMRQSPRMDVGGRFGITLTEARWNLFRRSGMGFFSYGAHPRHVAVAQRQRAALLR